MESGQAQQKQTAAEVKREISEIRQAILKYVLDDSVVLPDLPCFKSSRPSTPGSGPRSPPQRIASPVFRPLAMSTCPF